MGIFARLSTLIRSNINDLISRAENPEKMLNQLIVDMRTQLAKAKQQVASAIADEKRLSAQAEQEKKLAEDWEKRAVLAVQEGRDDPARQAPGGGRAGPGPRGRFAGQAVPGRRATLRRGRAARRAETEDGAARRRRRGARMQAARQGGEGGRAGRGCRRRAHPLTAERPSS